jgi:predicted nucleic acid-binding protein
MTARVGRFGLDSNILVYAVEADAGEKGERAALIVRRAIATRRCVLTLQNIGEFYHVCARTRKAPAEAVARRAADYGQLFPVIEPRMEDSRLALAEAAAGRFSYWAALLLATLSRSGCTILLSEDMADGARLGSITVRNPLLGKGLPSDVAAMLS